MHKPSDLVSLGAVLPIPPAVERANAGVPHAQPLAKSDDGRAADCATDDHNGPCAHAARLIVRAMPGCGEEPARRLLDALLALLDSLHASLASLSRSILIVGRLGGGGSMLPC